MQTLSEQARLAKDDLIEAVSLAKQALDVAFEKLADDELCTECSTIVYDALKDANNALSNSFAPLRKVRKELFALESGSKPQPEA